MKTSADASSTNHTFSTDDFFIEPQIYPLGGPRPSSTPVVGTEDRLRFEDFVGL